MTKEWPWWSAESRLQQLPSTPAIGRDRGSIVPPVQPECTTLGCFKYNVQLCASSLTCIQRREIDQLVEWEIECNNQQRLCQHQTNENQAINSTGYKYVLTSCSTQSVLRS